MFKISEIEYFEKMSNFGPVTVVYLFSNYGMAQKFNLEYDV